MHNRIMIKLVVVTMLISPRQPLPARSRQPRRDKRRRRLSKAPDNLDFRTANVMSEGVRLNAELFSLKSPAGKPLPTVIMAHGWGGTAANFRRDAIDLANAGYMVITFDYRGWGQSDGRIVLTTAPEKKDGRRFHGAGRRAARIHRSYRADDRLVQRHQLGVRQHKGGCAVQSRERRFRSVGVLARFSSGIGKGDGKADARG